MSDSEEDIIKIEKPGDVNDINIVIPRDKYLTKLIGQLVTLDRDNLNKIICKLGKTGAINPNENKFHTTSEKTMFKYFLKKRMSELEEVDEA